MRGEAKRKVKLRVPDRRQAVRRGMTGAKKSLCISGETLLQDNFCAKIESDGGKIGQNKKSRQKQFFKKRGEMLFFTD